MRRSSSLLLLSLLLSAGPAWSQRTVWVQRAGGEIGVGYDGIWSDLSIAPGSGRQHFEEWVQLDLSGAVSNPRLLGFDLGVRPIRAQTNWTGEPPSPNGGRSALNVYGRLSLLAGAPVSLFLGGRLWRDDHTDRLSFETQERVAEFEGRLSFRNPYLPATLDYEDRARDVTWRPNPLQSTSRDETIRTLRLTARNSKTNVTVEQLWYDDRVGQRDFNTFRTYLAHRLRWGKGSNLSSAFRYRNQSGTTPNELISWSQVARLQQSWTVWSDYSYSIFSQQSLGSETRGVTGQLIASWRALTELTLSVEGYGYYRSFNVGRSTYYRAQPQASFRTRLPLEATLLGQVAVGYEWHDQEPGDDGFGAVVDESHVIDPSGRFSLTERFVDLTSVVVTSADETIVFDPDFDYLLLEEDPFVNLVVLPGGRLQAGDTVLVDYRFQLMPAGSANAILGRYELEIRRGGLRLFHRRSIQDEVDGVGPSTLPLLRNIDDIATGIGFSGRVLRGSFSGLAQHRRRRGDTFDFTNYSLSARLRYALVTNLHASGGAGVSLRRGGRSELDILQGEGSLDWTPNRSLLLRGELAFWTLSDGGRDEAFLGGGINAEWRFGLFTLSARYDRLNWQNAFERGEDRLLARIVRRF